MFLWTLFLLISVGGLALIVWAVAGRRSRASERAREDGTLAILEERFARGEIDQEEFEERRRILIGAD